MAPTGKLRVGLQLGSPHNVIRDPVSGEMKGVAFDLGKELARRMGVPFEPVLYPSVGALLDAGKSGAWDVAFVGFSPARAKEWDFTALHLEMEFGYLVPGGSSISTMADVDRPGIRVAVQEKAQPDVFISRTLKNAVVVRASSLAGTVETLQSGTADAIFSIKPSLFEVSNQLPGSRVLDGRHGVDPHAMVMPKGRDAGLAYARQFIEDAKSEGQVKRRSSGWECVVPLWLRFNDALRLPTATRRVGGRTYGERFNVRFSKSLLPLRVELGPSTIRPSSARTSHSLTGMRRPSPL